MTHLWEVDHPYYCSESNCFSNDCNQKYASWEDYVADLGDFDLDLNLVFRFDWKRNDPEDEFYEHPERTHTSIDDNYRGYTLYLFLMQQRKGKFVAHEVSVCRADEPSVVEYLTVRYTHLQKLWEPLS